MRTYGLTMLPDNGSIVPVLMPFYTAEAHNSLERGSRPYSVVEIGIQRGFFQGYPMLHGPLPGRRSESDRSRRGQEF